MTQNLLRPGWPEVVIKSPTAGGRAPDVLLGFYGDGVSGVPPALLCAHILAHRVGGLQAQEEKL